MHHILKIENRWLDRVLSGKKTSEFRKNDRGYQAGDTVQFMSLWLYNDMDGTATYQHIENEHGEMETWLVHPELFTIGHVLNSSECDGMEDGYCMFSILPQLK